MFSKEEGYSHIIPLTFQHVQWLIYFYLWLNEEKEDHDIVLLNGLHEYKNLLDDAQYLFPSEQRIIYKLYK